jgi:hypothetical protein
LSTQSGPVAKRVGELVNCAVFNKFANGSFYSYLCRIAL